MAIRSYKILHGIANYECPLEVEASTNDFIHNPRSLREEKEKQIQKLVQWIFGKESAASTGTEKRMQNRIGNKGDECIDRK